MLKKRHGDVKTEVNSWRQCKHISYSLQPQETIHINMPSVKTAWVNIRDLSHLGHIKVDHTGKEV
jgi:hypothetical protein